jgi:hypothetical protein
MSESRLAYSKLLLSEFRDDLSIKKGISNRLSKSFLRELIGVASNHDKSLFDLYRRNCVAFLNVTRDLEAPTNFRYRIAFSLKYPLLLVLIVKILKFLRTFLIAPKVRHEFKFTLINPVFPIVKVIKFLGRRIGETK